MKQILTICLFLAVNLVSSAQTLEECHALAKAHYPEIRQYDLLAQTTQFTMAEAAKAWLPQISAGAQATWQNAVATFPEGMSNALSLSGMDIPGIRKDQYRISLQIDQPIWDGGQTRLKQQLAKAQESAEAALLDTDLEKISERIDDLYFGILLLECRIRSNEDCAARLDSTLAEVRSMVRNGIALQSDAYEIEAQRRGMEQGIAGLQATCESYRQILGLFIGQKVGTLERPSDPVRMDRVRPGIALLDRQIDVIQTQERQVRSSLMPQVGLFAQGYYGYPGLDMFKSMSSSQWTWNALVGIRINWNISALYTRESRLERLRVNRERAEVQKDLFRFNASVETMAIDGEIKRLERVLAEDGHIARLRKSIRISAEARYRNGVIRTSELLKAISDEQMADSAVQEHEIELLRRKYERTHKEIQYE